MNFKQQNISRIFPLGIQRGGLGGTKIVARVHKINGEVVFAFLLPLDYNVDPIPEYMVEAAIAKYGYDPLYNSPVLSSNEEFEEFISQLTNNISLEDKDEVY